jgi:uncharacterized protein YjbI with pentapeptide repeats
MSGADIRGARLSGANLVDADLSDADLAQADLTRARLTGVNLSRADLSDADLSESLIVLRQFQSPFPIINTKTNFKNAITHSHDFMAALETEIPKESLPTVLTT